MRTPPHTNAMRRTPPLLTLESSLMTDTAPTYMAISSWKTQIQLHAVNVFSKSFLAFLTWNKLHFRFLLPWLLMRLMRLSYFLYSIIYFSYTCVYIDTYRDQKMFKWNVSVSDHCCLHCDDVVYKADTVIDTIQYEDECRTTETTVCRIIPG